MSEYAYDGPVLYDEAALEKELSNAKTRRDKEDKEIKNLEKRLSEVQAERRYGGDIR